jgi:hypothetical protein
MSLGGMVLSLAALALGFAIGGVALKWIGVLSLAVYIASFAVGLGPVFWLFGTGWKPMPHFHAWPWSGSLRKCRRYRRMHNFGGFEAQCPAGQLHIRRGRNCDNY